MERIKKIGVCGCGFMGRQIAFHAAYHGYDVTAYDLNAGMFDPARAEVRKAFEWGGYAAEPGRTPEDVAARITYTTDFNQAFNDADLVIEAVPEKLKLKREIWEKLDGICPPRCIIGTNSSSMKVSSLEDATNRLDKVANIHYAPPISERRYVEIMGGSRTSPETIKNISAWVRTTNCIPLVAKKEIMGFVVNRLWRVVKKEALKMWAGGYADIEDIDRGWMLLTGMKAGPFGGMDYVGLDVVYDIEMSYHEDSGNPDDKPPEALREKVERGELGIKSGKGFYDNSDLKYLKPEFLEPYTGLPDRAAGIRGPREILNETFS